MGLILDIAGVFGVVMMIGLVVSSFATANELD